MMALDMDREVTNVERKPLVTRVPSFELRVEQPTAQKKVKWRNPIATYHALNECKLILFEKDHHDV